jgi:hypothetical protein
MFFRKKKTAEDLNKTIKERLLARDPPWQRVPSAVWQTTRSAGPFPVSALGAGKTVGGTPPSAGPQPHNGGHEMLTTEQRAELEHHGAVSIRFKLTQHGAGRSAAISGFKCGDITRGDIEDWLAEKSAEEAAQQSAILRWARIAGWAAIIGALLTAVGIAISIWLSAK